MMPSAENEVSKAELYTGMRIAVPSFPPDG